MDKEKVRDKYYQKTYGITLAEYDAKDAAQNHGCAICHRVPDPGKPRLAVDHNHAYDRMKIKIVAKRDEVTGLKSFFGCCVELGLSAIGTERKAVKEGLRRTLRRMSVRALLCWRCNKGLSYWRDNADKMSAAAEYLRMYPSPKEAV